MKLQSLQFYINSKTINLHHVKSVIIFAKMVCNWCLRWRLELLLPLLVRPYSLAELDLHLHRNLSTGGPVLQSRCRLRTFSPEGTSKHARPELKSNGMPYGRAQKRLSLLMHKVHRDQFTRQIRAVSTEQHRVGVKL